MLKSIVLEYVGCHLNQNKKRMFIIFNDYETQFKANATARKPKLYNGVRRPFQKRGDSEKPDE
jgi:hypothetical protein